MPSAPRRSEKRQDYLSRATSDYMGEGMPRLQARAVAHSKWKRKGKKKRNKTQY